MGTWPAWPPARTAWGGDVHGVSVRPLRLRHQDRGRLRRFRLVQDRTQCRRVDRSPSGSVFREVFAYWTASVPEHCPRGPTRRPTTPANCAMDAIGWWEWRRAWRRGRNSSCCPGESSRSLTVLDVSSARSPIVIAIPGSMIPSRGWSRARELDRTGRIEGGLR